MADDLARMRAAGDALAVAVEATLPGWVTSSVGRILEAWGRLPPDRVEAAQAAARAAAPALARRIAADLRELCTTDPALQRRTPLQVLEAALELPTAILQQAGVPPVVRDPFDERVRPADRYDLAPRSFADLGDPRLTTLAVTWGAAKARVMVRRRAEPGS